MVHIQDLSLAFGEQVLFEHLDLTLLPNEWVSLLGCSGVGKSTLLRLIAGLEIQGKIQGNIISHPNIRVSWLPQKDTLYPWLSIVDNVQLENVLFGNKSAKTTIQAKVKLNQRFALILEREPLFVSVLQIIEHSFYEDVLTCLLVQVVLWLEELFLQIYSRIVRFLIGRYQ